VVLSHKFIETLAAAWREWQRSRGVAAHGFRRTVMECRTHLTPLNLTRDEQARLEEWARRPGRARSLALRARIVLVCHTGRSNREAARLCGVSAQTIGKWRARFVAGRAAGLLDQPRAGAPRSISDEQVATVLAKTLHERPPHGARWSSRRLARVVGISQRAVVRIWREFGVS
jgi:transposase